MYRNSLLFCLTTMAIMAGCNSQTTQPPAAAKADGHSHAAGDELVWPLKERIEDTGIEIWLGHHGDHFHGGDHIEPAISITSAGKPDNAAKVFVSIVNPDNSESVSHEVATVYEPETEDEIAHYAQGELTIPSEAKEFTIRYRLKTPTHAEEIVRNVTIKTAH